MRKSKTLLAFLLLAALTALSGCGRIIHNQDPKVIALVSKSDGGAFWDTVLAGAEDAALENGYAITFRGPELEGPEGIHTQKAIVDLALENDVCGLVIAAVGPGFDSRLRYCYENQIPVIQMDSGLFPRDLDRVKKEKCSPLKASVYTNSREAARINAEHLFEAIRQDIQASLLPYEIGIIQHDLTSTGEDRAEGFEERFRELGEADPTTRDKFLIHVVRCTSNKEGTYVSALDRLQKMGCRAVFMTNQEVAEQLYDELQSHRQKYDYLLFTGFDSGKKQVSWLRDSSMPRLLGSVTQDAYLIGYNAVLQCINALEARGVTAFVEIPGAWYDMENLEEMLNRRLVSE